MAILIQGLGYTIIGWETAQLAKCLPHKYEDLNLDPQSHRAAVEV